MPTEDSPRICNTFPDIVNPGIKVIRTISHSAIILPDVKERRGPRHICSVSIPFVCRLADKPRLRRTADRGGGGGGEGRDGDGGARCSHTMHRLTYAHTRVFTLSTCAHACMHLETLSRRQIGNAVLACSD